MPLWSSFFYYQVPHIRRAIDMNLRRLVDLSPLQRKILAFRTFTNYCHCIANAYRHHAGAELTIPANIFGIDTLQEHLSGGRGAVLATGHLGNWHLGPYYLAKHGLPPVTVVMHEEPNQRTQQIEASLRDQRMRVVYPGRDPMVLLELRAALKRGELVGIQMDRPTMENGIDVPCAGGTATFASGPALLSRVCDVPVIPVFFPLDQKGVRIVIEPPLWAHKTDDRDQDLLELTTRLAQIYGQIIQRYPEQWFNFYDFWKA